MDLSRISIRPLLAYYFGATPLFFLLDVAWGLSVRAAFFQDFGARLAYYGFCLVCGLVAWRWPGRSAWVGLAESGGVLVLLVVSFMAPILTLPGELLADPYAPIVAPTAERIINFVIAAGVAWWSFERRIWTE